MSKAKTLAELVSTGSIFADGGVSAAEVTGLGTLATLNDASLTADVTGTLPIGNGGTNATTADGALTALGGTTVGTGVFKAVDAAAGLTALGAASSGANSNITSLTGLTTALSPAQGGTGLTAAGTAGNLLTSNGTAWTSTAPAPSAGTLEAIATGSLSNGSTVIVNADGTVSVVGIALGTPVVFESAAVLHIYSVYDSTNNKVVIVYSDLGNSDQATAIVGTVSGNSISFGTAVTFASINTSSLSIAYNTTGSKVVVVYRDQQNSNFGRAIVGTVSGTSISFGTPTVFLSEILGRHDTTYDATNNRIVIAFADNNTTSGRAIVGTVSGTSISFGTAVVFQSGNVANVPIKIINASANNRVVILYSNGNNSFYGTAIVGDVSGTSISFGTAVVFDSNFIGSTDGAYDTANGKVVVVFRRDGGRALVGTVSGTSISFGALALIVEGGAAFGLSSTTFNSSTNKIVTAFRGTSGAATASLGTVNGTSISFETPIVFLSGSLDNSFSTIFDPTSSKVVISFRPEASPNFGQTIVLPSSLTSTNLTSENYIGISSAAYTNGQTATIQVVGSVDDAQSGLTAGQSYFIQNNGTLGLDPASPSVFAGTAVSATKLIVKG